MFTVNYTRDGITHFLRGTVWAGYFDRADKFNTVEDANKAIDKAMVFLKKSARKNITIVPCNK